MLRERQSPPRDIFTTDPWNLSARFHVKLQDELVAQTETMFALANGYLGMRGTIDEGRPVQEPGVFLNGFYEFRPITYGEHAYGFPRVGQSMVGCPDGTVLRLFVDDEPFVGTEAEIVSFHRTLDLKAGALRREVTWTTPTGKRLRLRTTRLVSFDNRHLAAIDWELSLDNDDADIVISSELVHPQPLPVVAEKDDPRLAVAIAGRILEPAGRDCDELRILLGYITRSSRLVLGCGMDHVLTTDCRYVTDFNVEDNAAAVVFKVRGERGRSIRLTKFLGYHYSDHGTAEDMRTQVGWTLDRAMSRGFSVLLDTQKTDVARFWARSDVEVVNDDPRLQQVIRWNLFQLLQASERAEGHGVGTRGLTGSTYEGHYFWDMEIYVLPFLVYTNPRVARHLLKFRYDTLDRARARAAELGHCGATFPWRTINGDEASAYYAAGTAQYHINADIVHMIRKYVEVSGDDEFMQRYGAEILIETARLWRDLGFFSQRRNGRFCINAVTGPDEYNAVVDNNYFTNLMAQQNMRYAARVVRAMKADHPDVYEGLVARTGLGAEEPDSWDEAADCMYLPYDERLKVHPQDDDFLDKELWDFANTPDDHYPLLLHYHPLNLYRSQVIKQADTVLAMFLLGDQFTAEDKKRNFDYYDPITTHDSSLSVCIQSIVANEIGYRRKALEYFHFAATMDLSDIGGNMRHGAHIASIGGTWMALVYGFGGLRDHRGKISFHPRIPSEWKALRFPLTIRGRRIRVEIDHTITRYRLIEGDTLTIHHLDEEIVLTADAGDVSRPTPPPLLAEPLPGPGAADPGRPHAER
ncbi:Maltose phosphorylase [Rhodovulum sp. PH10]|uniref:glycoside hydrolase family 65 protein n=1 Tax=Rhodovulum sp. PH10 TaxID=1187851 RepID=UPI00027C1F38|nr:glycosyl hydrolase family 65 protein [Rhodovulum sp. PH10]EJW09537.1 Maltose phosphorylase [Rhodovulum sp. PH10]